MSSIPHHRESILPVERAPRFVVILGLHVLALAVEVVTPALGQATMNVLSYRQPWAGVDAVFTVTVMGMTTVLPFAVTTIFLIHIEARSAVVATAAVKLEQRTATRKLLAWHVYALSAAPVGSCAAVRFFSTLLACQGNRAVGFWHALVATLVGRIVMCWSTLLVYTTVTVGLRVIVLRRNGLATPSARTHTPGFNRSRMTVCEPIPAVTQRTCFTRVTGGPRL